MGIASGSFGKWMATDCNNTHGFICSQDVGEFSQTLWTCRETDPLQTFLIHNILSLFSHVQILVLP